MNKSATRSSISPCGVQTPPACHMLLPFPKRRIQDREFTRLLISPPPLSANLTCALAAAVTAATTLLLLFAPPFCMGPALTAYHIPIPSHG